MDPIAHLAGCCYLNHPTEGEEPGHWGVTGKPLTEKQSGNALFKIVHVGSECLFILVLVLDVLVTSLRHKQEGHGGPFKDQIAKKKLQRILGGKNMPPIPWAPPTFRFAPAASGDNNCLSARARLDEENYWVLHLKRFRSRRLRNMSHV